MSFRLTYLKPFRNKTLSDSPGGLLDYKNVDEPLDAEDTGDALRKALERRRVIANNALGYQGEPVLPKDMIVWEGDEVVYAWPKEFTRDPME